MTENDPQLPEKIRKALKESPELVPPESFYRDVLKEIERKRAPAEEKTPWYWGYPAKGLATACVLAVIVLVTHETHKTQPALLQPMSQSVDQLSTEKNQRMISAGKNAPKSLADTKEVQERLHSSISNLVETPSPFEDVDKEAKRDLDERREDRPVDTLKTAPISDSKKAALQDGLANNAQVRQTVSGEATQGSFNSEQNVLAKKQKVYRAVPQAIAFSYGEMASGASVAASPLSMTRSSQEWKGPYSGISTFQTVVIRTQEDWQKLWLDHNGYIVPPPPPPDVDFVNFMVIGVFDGTKPSGGYAVQIVDVKTLPDKIVVSYAEVAPAPGLAATQAQTEPYQLQVVPKSLLPISFEKINK